MKHTDNTMNKEMQEWIRETQKQSKKVSEQKEKDAEKQNKKPKGNCAICGNRKAEAVCIKCNRSVCSSCYFKIIGVCKECVPKDIAEKWEGKQPDWEKELGVEWVG
mgnify:CR=1 FL=1